MAPANLTNTFFPFACERLKKEEGGSVGQRHIFISFYSRHLNQWLESEHSHSPAE